MALDDARLLAQRSELGYVTNHQQALPHEPEALTADDLNRIALLARDREQDTWRTSRDRLLSELEHLRVHIHTPGVGRFARAIEREIAAFDRKPL